MEINIGEFLTRRSNITPDREGLVCEDIRRTYKQLNERANRLANAMTALGIGHGERVSILAFNEPEYYDTYFGLGKIGATLVPVNYRLAGPEIQYILSDCESKVFVFGREYAEVVDSIRNDIPAKEFIAISDDPPQWARSYEALIGDVSDEEPEIVGGGDDTLTILYTSGTTGRPFFHTEVRVVNDNGHDMAPGEKGEVLLRAPNMMKGYLNRPEETAAAIKDGWLHTGDIGKLDEDGFLYILDRKKDMIISGGENIYPAEIEDALLNNPRIKDVGVIGYPHEKWGEAVKAIVVLKEGENLTEAELIEWCQGRIGKFKIPKAVMITDAIPRTPTGKILKTELRKQFN